MYGYIDRHFEEKFLKKIKVYVIPTKKNMDKVKAEPLPLKPPNNLTLKKN